MQVRFHGTPFELRRRHHGRTQNVTLEDGAAVRQALREIREAILNNSKLWLRQ